MYLTLNKNKILNYNFLKISTSADSILHFFDFPIQFEIENRKSSTPHKYSRIYNKNTIVVQPILGRIPMMFSSGGVDDVKDELFTSLRETFFEVFL